MYKYRLDGIMMALGLTLGGVKRSPHWGEYSEAQCMFWRSVSVPSYH